MINTSENLEIGMFRVLSHCAPTIASAANHCVPNINVLFHNTPHFWFVVLANL